MSLGLIACSLIDLDSLRGVLDASVDSPIPLGDAGCDADLTSDPENCGVCGRSCVGSVCAEGSCKAVLLGSSEADIAELLIARGFVYYRVSEGIRKVPVDGGVFTLVGHNCKDHNGMSVTDDILTAMCVCGTPRLHVPDDTLIETLGSGGCGSHGETLTSRPGFVYWNEGNALNRWRQQQDGGWLLQNQVYIGGGGIVGLAATASRVYFLTRMGGLRVVPLDGGLTSKLAEVDIPASALRPQAGALPIAADDRAVFFLTFPDGGRVGDLVTRDLNTNESRVLLSADELVAIAIDATHVYATSRGTPPDYKDGRVLRAPRTGGAVDVLATKQHNPAAIAVDDAWVIWANRGAEDAGATGTLARLPK